jgi:hypothetical protein
VAILEPALAKLLPNYPDITVEIVAQHGLAILGQELS